MEQENLHPQIVIRDTKIKKKLDIIPFQQVPGDD